MTSQLLVSTERASAAELDVLHRRYVQERDPRDCERLIESYKHLAQSLGRRMSRRLAEREDVTQVAMLGLMKAVNRFDPDRGVGFTTFAWRTIEGEVKRYFRDSSWSVHVPRSLQERSMVVARAIEDLTHECGHSPTVSDIAQHLNLTDDEVVEVLELQRACRPMSLDRPELEDDEMRGATVQVGEDEAGYDLTDNRQVIGQLLRLLPDREREVVRLRFVDQLTQSEIATRIGISQMHVSRLLSKSLARLRQAQS
jgi:RNA polymerase sigma-B factor